MSSEAIVLKLPHSFNVLPWQIYVLSLEHNDQHVFHPKKPNRSSSSSKIEELDIKKEDPSAKLSRFRSMTQTTTEASLATREAKRQASRVAYVTELRLTVR